MRWLGVKRIALRLANGLIAGWPVCSPAISTLLNLLPTANNIKSSCPDPLNAGPNISLHT
jgi:hypothetical protein